MSKGDGADEWIVPLVCRQIIRAECLRSRTGKITHIPGPVTAISSFVSNQTRPRVHSRKAYISYVMMLNQSMMGLILTRSKCCMYQ